MSHRLSEDGKHSWNRAVKFNLKNKNQLWKQLWEWLKKKKMQNTKIKQRNPKQKVTALLRHKDFTVSGLIYDCIVPVLC